MIWFVLSATYVAGMIAGAALILWAEKLNDKPSRQVILDNSKSPNQTDNDDPRKWERYVYKEER